MDVTGAPAPVSPTYFVGASFYSGGGAAVAGVQVLVVGRVGVHAERQDKAPGEDPAQGVVHLQEEQPRSAWHETAAVGLSSVLTSSRASPDLRRFWIL